jgi:membrane protein implicated in regulation of membrane protease activity
MARLLPLAGIAFLVVVCVAAMWLVKSIERRDVRQRRRIARREALADHQQSLAIEDLERHRDRINTDLDRMYAERDRTLGQGDSPGT